MLDRLRLLDLTDEKGYLCGKLLADLGADVIKVEKPGGDETRNQGPFWHDESKPHKSLSWAAYNAGKRGITLDISSGRGQDLFRKLVEKSDVIVESFPSGFMASLGLDYPELARINEKIILTSVTPFGQTGPYSDFAASEMVISALAGVLYLVGQEHRAPVHTNMPNSIYSSAALDAAIGTLMAYYECQYSGTGQHVDVSAQASAELLTVHAALNWEVNQFIATRKGPALHASRGGWPRRVHWKCKDGYVAFAVFPAPTAIRSARNLAAWMRSEGFETGAFGEAHWETMKFGELTRDQTMDLEDPVSMFFAEHTMAELYSGALERQLLLAPVSTIKNIAESPQLQALNYWKQVDEPELGGTIGYPTFMQSTDVPLGVPYRTPFIGEHNWEIYIDELGLSKAELQDLMENKII